MVKLLFKDGGSVIDPTTGPQSYLLERLKNVMDRAFTPLHCPNHNASSYATLILNVEFGSTDWEVTDYCCQEFSAVVESEMPYPWSHARRHQKS
ncbi:MAG TPA: hypothetical protein VIS48_14055 [Candidatus Kryptonia bacterium]